jgi:hypothetical protein
MRVRSITHQTNEWFSVIDRDLDVDWDTGAYVGISDMLKLSDGHWYRQDECVYLIEAGSVESCMT